MALTDKTILALLAGVGGAAALFFLLSKRHAVVNPPEVVVAPILEKTEETCLERILELQQSKLTLKPDQAVIQELSQLMANVTEDELALVKANSDLLAYSVSEWLFYHTLRSRKEVHWDSITGMMDESLSPQERDLGKRIASTMRKAYWDKHLEDLTKIPPNFALVLERLAELQVRINGYQKSKKREIFDLGFVHQVAQADAFDRLFFISLVRAVVLALEELESPAAHEETVKWFAQIEATQETAVSKSQFHSEIVHSLEFLFSQLDLMDAEIATFKSNQLAAETRRKKEREVFRTLIKDKVIQVPILRHALSVIPVNTNSASLNGVIIELFKSIILKGVLSKDTPATIESLIPEAQLLGSIKERLNRNVVDRACILVGLHSQLNAFGEGKKFLEQPHGVIMEMINKLSELSDTKAIVDEAASHIIRFSNKGIPEERLETIQKGIDQCRSTQSQVHQLYVKRVASLLEKGVHEACTKVESNALGTNPWFLSVCAKETSSIIAELIEFIAEHLHVYLPIYRDISTKNL